MWVVLGLLAVVIFLIVNLSKKNKHDFWEQNGVRSVDISKLASSFELLLGLKSDLNIDMEVYKEMGNDKFCGIVEAGNPILIVKDLDLVKQILIKDFDHFVDRGVLFSNAKSPCLTRMLPSLLGKEWRGVRATVSPTFTSGKMRRIMEYFNSCGIEWTNVLKTKPPGTIVDILEIGGQYAIDVIASSVFGLNAGSIKDSNSVFLQKAMKVGETSWSLIIKQNLAKRLPALFKLLRLEAMDESAVQFFEDMFARALKARESGEVGYRNDFLQLLIETRKKGAMRVDRLMMDDENDDELDEFEKDALLHDEKPNAAYLLDDGIVQGQGFVFFLAGYQGITFSIAYGANALAFHPEIQERLQEEIDSIFREDGTIDYDDMNELPYLEMFLSELLRFYPITPRVHRTCTKTYERPDLGLKLLKGQNVSIPVIPIHRDPKYYANPDKFDPEHFNAKNIGERNPYAYLPFGHGPRNCIGKRFALVEIKAALCHLIHNFSVEPTNKSIFPIKTKLVGEGLHIHGKVELKLIPRNH